MNQTPRKERRGASILLLSIVFMVILLLLSITLFNVIPAEMHAANRSHQDLNGHYVARAGIRDAMTWIQFQMDAFEASHAEADLPDYNTGTIAAPVYPNIVTYEANAAAKRPFDEGDWRFEVEIVPQQDTKTLANSNSVRFFAVRSTAFHNNNPIRRIDVLLEQNSFALYAFLSKNWDPNSTMIITGQNAFQGPVHTDGFWNFDVSAVSGSWSGNTAFFSDLVSHASMDPNSPAGGDGNRYTGGQPFDANGPLAGRYEQIFADGRDDLRVKNQVELPSSTGAAFDSTWTNPDPNSIPGVEGAFVSVDANGATGPTGRPLIDGGILVIGDHEEVNLRLDQHGNQKTVLGRRAPNGVNVVTHTDWQYTGLGTYYECGSTKCTAWGPPPGGGGGGGGAGGGGLNNVCISWAYFPKTCEHTSKTKIGTHTHTNSDYDPFRTEIYEVTEADVTLNAVDLNGNTIEETPGNPPVAPVGTTLVVRSVRDNSSTGWQVADYEILDGQINGNIYIDGDVGGRSWRYGDSYRDSTPEAGLWGIAKGSVATDANGVLQTDPGTGEYIYNNKAIITPLTESIKVGGDLLQFDPTRFNANKGSIDFESMNAGDNRVRNWVEYAALDPHAAGGPELSPNNNHVLGVITRDVWMAAPKHTSGNRRKELLGTSNPSQASADLYGVFLAGSTHRANFDPNDTSSPIVTDGGFGTKYWFRDSINDGLGKYNVIGGVIQGTETQNYLTNGNLDMGNGGRRTHHWVDSSGSVGYDLNMTYDLAATRQRLFPLQTNFGIIRMFESSVRNR